MPMAWQSGYFQPPRYGYPGYAPTPHSLKQSLQYGTHSQQYHGMNRYPQNWSGNISCSTLPSSETQKYTGFPVAPPQPVNSASCRAVGNPGGFPVAPPQPVNSASCRAVGNPGGFPVAPPQPVNSASCRAVGNPGGFPVAPPQPVNSASCRAVGNPGGFPVAPPQPVNSASCRAVGNPGGFPVAPPQPVNSASCRAVGNPGGFPVAPPQPVNSASCRAVGNPGGFPVAPPQPVNSASCRAVRNPGGFPVAPPQPVNCVPCSTVGNPGGFPVPSSQQGSPVPRSGQSHLPSLYENGGRRPEFHGPPMPNTYQHGEAMYRFPVNQESMQSRARLGHGYNLGQGYPLPLPAAQSNGAFNNVSQLERGKPHGSGYLFSAPNTFPAKLPPYNQSCYQLHHSGTSARQSSECAPVQASVPVSKSVTSTSSRSCDKTDRRAKTVSKQSNKRDGLSERLLSSKPVKDVHSSKPVETLQTRIDRLIDNDLNTFLAYMTRDEGCRDLSTTSLQNICKCARNPVSCDLHNPLWPPALTACGPHNHASPVVHHSLSADAEDNVDVRNVLQTDSDIMTHIYRGGAEGEVNSHASQQRADPTHLQPSALDGPSPQRKSAAEHAVIGGVNCRPPAWPEPPPSDELSAFRHCEQEAVSPATEMRSEPDTEELENEEMEFLYSTCMICSKVLSKRDELSNHLSVHMKHSARRHPKERDVLDPNAAGTEQQEQHRNVALEPRGSHLLCATSSGSEEKLLAHEQEQAVCEERRKTPVSEMCSLDQSVYSSHDVDDNTNASTCSQDQRKSLQTPVVGQRYTLTVETDLNSRADDSLQNVNQLTRSSKGLGRCNSSNCSTDMEQDLNSSPPTVQQSKQDSETQPMNSGGVVKTSTNNFKNRKPNSPDKPNPASSRPCWKQDHADQSSEAYMSIQNTDGHNAKKGNSGEMPTARETSLASDLQNSTSLCVHHGGTSEQKHRRKLQDPPKSAAKEISSADGRVPVDTRTTHPQQHKEDGGGVKRTEVSEKLGHKSVESDKTMVSIKGKNDDLPVHSSQKRKHLEPAHSSQKRKHLEPAHSSQKRKRLDIVTNASHEKEQGSNEDNLLVNQDANVSKSDVFQKTVTHKNSPTNSVEEKGVGEVHAEQKSVRTERVRHKSSHKQGEKMPVSHGGKKTERSSGHLDGVPSSAFHGKHSKAAAAFHGKQTPSTSHASFHHDKHTSGAEARDTKVNVSVRESPVQITKIIDGHTMPDMAGGIINHLNKWKKEDKHGCVTSASAERTDDLKHAASCVSSPKKKPCSSHSSLAGDGWPSSRMESTDVSGKTLPTGSRQSVSPDCAKLKICVRLKNILKDGQHSLPIEKACSVEKRNLSEKDVSVTNSDCRDPHPKKSLLGDRDSTRGVDLDRQLTFCVKCSSVFTKRSAYDKHGCCQLGREPSAKGEETLGEHRALDKGVESGRDGVEKRDFPPVLKMSKSVKKKKSCKSQRWKVAKKELKQAKPTSCRELKQAKPTSCRELKQAKPTSCRELKQAKPTSCRELKQAKPTSCRGWGKNRPASAVQTMFPCDHCEQSYSSRGGMLFHLKTVHKKV